MNLQICTTNGEDLLLRDVSTYLVDNSMLRVLTNDGRQQNYPLVNVRWYGPEEVFKTPPKIRLKPITPDCDCNQCRVARAEKRVVEDLGL